MGNEDKSKMITNVRQIDRSKMTLIEYLRWLYQELNNQPAVKSVMKNLADK